MKKEKLSNVKKDKDVTGQLNQGKFNSAFKSEKT
jgi:hypothetical protein